MKFIDEYSFFAKAGDGGDGVVRWRREKFVPKGGPNGGDGGRGGDFVLRAVRDINRLARISHKTDYEAERGQDGASSSKTGRDGERYVLEVPVGSVVTNTDTATTYELMQDGQETLLLSGGAGGYGNEHFKSASNRKPEQCTKGKAGEQGHFRVELRLIADIGLVGLPNAGKSSLLNALTNASAKVAAYEFTTLDPNLGVMYGVVLADIPGLIEGASEGKGLGHKFLRHISRTRLIVHCISLELEKPLEAYEIVRRELSVYEEVSKIPELIVLTKTDCVSVETLDQVSKLFAQEGKQTHAVSVLDDASVHALGDELVKIIRSL